MPEDLLRRIGGRGRQARRQLALKRPGIGRELAEFQSLPRWSQRIGFVRELLFPPASYMRQRFGATGPITLTVAYLRRMARGLGRLVSTGIGKAGGGGRHDD